MKLIVNHHYTNEDIRKYFGVSTQGGMRRHKDNLVLISKIYKNIYPDEWHGHVLYYTGMGQTGDQDINFAQNKTLNHSQENGIHVYLFINEAPNNYIYAGPVKLEGKPNSVRDQTGRKVIRFPIVTTNPLRSYPVKIDYQKSIKYNISQTSTNKLMHLVRPRNTQGRRHKVHTYNYVKNKRIDELAKRFAKGHCQLCGQKMFVDKRTNELFLEVYHVNKRVLSIRNVIALCPNCYMKMLYMSYVSDNIKALKAKTKILSRRHGFYEKLYKNYTD